MARFAGVDIPNNKRIVISLTYIYGIGPSTASRILKDCGISEDIRTKDLTTEQETAIRQQIDTIKRLMEIGCYRGMRHRRGLPVRGQRTRTNARTRKGPRRTVANKKK